VSAITAVHRSPMRYADFFTALVREPRRPARLQAGFACADHLHPNDADYKAMAEPIDLKLLGVGK
jgi:lysophospholipase L1-like esterase